MPPKNPAPEMAAVRHLLDLVRPGSELLSVEALPGSYSNYTHLVRARSVAGAEARIVVRRYAVFGDYDRGEKAHREFKTLELALDSGIPVPEPLLLDETGALLGSPGIVTGYVPGSQIEQPVDPHVWARDLAAMLVKIHNVPCDAAAQDFLLDANSEATWFVRADSAPEYMKAHPDGLTVWRTTRARWPSLGPALAALVHIDYWPGNVLWHQGRISAVVDWEEAAYGDPTIDVAYARMNMVLSGYGSAAEEFLVAYERLAGRKVANLGFWELAAAVRPMFHSEGWLADSAAKGYSHQFVADALNRVGD